VNLYNCDCPANGSSRQETTASKNCTGCKINLPVMGRSRSNSTGSWSKKSGKKSSNNKAKKKKSNHKAAKSTVPKMGSKKKGLTPFPAARQLYVSSTDGRVAVVMNKSPQRSSKTTTGSRVKKTASPKPKKNSKPPNNNNNNNNNNKKAASSHDVWNFDQAPASKKRKLKETKKKEKSSNNNNRMEPPFGLQLPSKHAGAQIRSIPWMTEAMELQRQQQQQKDTRESKKNNNNNNTTKPLVRLPTHDVHPQRLQQLSNELRALANYVRLTPGEVRARQTVVDELTQMVRGMPTFNRQQQQQHIRFDNNTGAPQQPDSPEFRPFGSYAALPVCSFQSDIDLALWNAVQMFPVYNKKKQQQQQPTTPKTCTKQDQLDKKWKGALAAFDLEQTPTEEEEKRQKRRKSALAALDFENGLSPGNHEDDVVDDDEESNHPDEHEEIEKEEKLGNQQSQDDNEKTSGVNEKLEAKKEEEMSTLFVIDRVGDGLEDEQRDGNNAIHRDGARTNGQFADAEEETNTTKRPVESSDQTQAENQPTNANEDGANSGSDQDSADKLKHYGPEKTDSSKAATTERFDHLVSMSSSEDEDESYSDDDDESAIMRQLHDGIPEDDDDDAFNNMEVGFVGPTDDEDEDEEPTMPTAETHTVRRHDALEALVKLSRKLRRSTSPMATSLNFIRNARVPIIKFMSEAGVEVDISIGGLNSADTSLYAAQQCERYESFSPVVLALKIIMGQYELDTPFTGGLGSFKLYVLVAHHIQKHMRLGGSDDPGEIFLSFLFRYGSSTGDHCVDKKARTALFQDSLIECESGFEADLSNVFKVTECCHLFGSIWRRLWSRVRQKGKSSGKDKVASLLAESIHIPPLTSERQKSLDMASAASMSNNPYNQGSASPSSTAPAAFNRSAAKPTQSVGRKASKKRLMDKTADQIAAGYGVNLKASKRARR